MVSLSFFIFSPPKSTKEPLSVESLKRSAKSSLRAVHGSLVGKAFEVQELISGEKSEQLDLEHLSTLFSWKKNGWDLSALHSVFLCGWIPTIGVVATAQVIFHPLLRIGELVHLFVDKPWRRHGIASATASLLETSLKEIGIVTFWTHAEEGISPSSMGNACFFQALGWRREATPHLFYCDFDARSFQPLWLTRSQHYLERGWRLEPWAAVSSEDRNELISLANDLLCPDELSPLSFLETLWSYGSVKLITENYPLAGWACITLSSERELCYRSLWVHPALRGGGSALALLGMAIHLQQSSPHPFAYCEINESKSSFQWKKFIRRWIAPYADRTAHRFRFYKSIS